jgi:hypothetical protein
MCDKTAPLIVFLGCGQGIKQQMGSRPLRPKDSPHKWHVQSPWHFVSAPMAVVGSRDLHGDLSILTYNWKSTLGLNCVPQSTYGEALIPSTQNATVLRHRVFTEVIKLK